LSYSGMSPKKSTMGKRVFFLLPLLDRFNFLSHGGKIFPEFQGRIP